MIEFMPGVRLAPRIWHEIKGFPAVGSIQTPACFPALKQGGKYVLVLPNTKDMTRSTKWV